MEFRNHLRESRRRTDQYALLLLISSTRLSQFIVLRQKILRYESSTLILYKELISTIFQM